MNDLASIKLMILEEKNIELLLEEMGMDNITFEQGGELITCRLPDRFNSSNNRAVQIKMNEHLTCYIRNRSDFRGDIYSLVSYIVFDARDDEINRTLTKAKSFICEVFGIDAKGVRKLAQRTDYAKRLKELAKKAHKNEFIPNVPIPENTLDKYADLYPDVWVDEGISRTALDFFEVRVDVESGRIMLPIRNHKGQLVGTKGRGYYLPYDPKRKYLYLDKCDQSKELFGFWIAKKFIKKKKIVYIFEGEKSVMKCFDNRFYEAVSVGSSSISDRQVQMINSLEEDIQIILAFDKGKEPEEIQKVAEIFKNNDVYAIVDTLGLLEEKDSPIDKGFEVFKQLVDECCFAIN